MINGIFSSAAGAWFQDVRVGVISNNLANANTTGFKKDFAVFMQRLPEAQETPGLFWFARPEIEVMGGGLFLSETRTDFGQGHIEPTGGIFDLALEGEGFFVVSDGQRNYYTRAGNFTRDHLGRLALPGGKFFLMTTGGDEVRVPPGANFDVGKDGVIRINGEEAGTVATWDFADRNYLRKVGDNVYDYIGEGEGRPANAVVLQRHLERSEVNVISEMAELIKALRTYEINLSALRNQDGTIDRTVNQVGRPLA